MVIHAVIAALALASDGAVLNAVQPSHELIAPVEVTVKKLSDLGEPYEMQRRRHEKVELERREFEKRDLEENRAIWAGKQVANYRFTVWSRGAWYCTRAIVVTVRGEEVVSSEYARDPGACKVPEAAMPSAEPYETVPNLFAFVDQLVNHSNTLPAVQYDTQYGYPLRIANDRWEVSDDEFAVYVRDFEVLE